LRPANSTTFFHLSVSALIGWPKASGVWIKVRHKQGARGTLRSVYCRDPDGSLIEISSYADGGI
jgi:catechol 2,3-dioxygenase-like lactoylglutathione lyase family enzyme